MRTRSVEPVGELVRVAAQVVVRAVVLAKQDLAAVHPAGQPTLPVQAEAGVRGGPEYAEAVASVYCFVLPMYVAVLLRLADVRRPAVDRLLVLDVRRAP
ncbi:hypothetical protein [Streptomyces sp. AK02-04a]|uniref:hypothetical protein n=1 Tax=Streptomyces sp. AK02-04a TaxID=3028649 RepID=UPI0029AEA3D9|nr:hypothetical protein [Streptomyces sp. AK02-04a]MDX3755516.1 hypothetical protein [Streptomyces sp. AK02-04a]